MKKGNLLLIDDEPMLLASIKNLLEDYADNIFTAENGLEGLAVLEKEQIHCVVCDINMPKMNGLEVIKKVRSKQNEIPFIFYTANGNEALMREAIKYGAYDFVSKIEIEVIEEVVPRGLKEGVLLEAGIKPTEDVFMSEYQKLISEINSKKEHS